MGATTFREADYFKPRKDLQVRDDDGSWRAVSIYRHKKLGTLVLFFGGTEYEGLGERYRWDASGVLIDNDGDEIATRFLSDAGKDGDSGTDAAAKGRRAPSKRPRTPVAATTAPRTGARGTSAPADVEPAKRAKNAAKGKGKGTGKGKGAVWNEDDYTLGRQDLEVEEEDGAWRDVDIYKHKHSDDIVLYYGGTEYEGLDGDYRFDAQGVLLDPDGDQIRTRWRGKGTGKGKLTTRGKLSPNTRS